MSQPGAGARRRRSKRSAPQPSRVRRPLVALASVILVITPISWILLHEPQSDQADASVPYVTRDDDTYITASNEPVAKTTDPPAKKTPTPTPTAGTPKPSATPTAGETATPTADPTDRPTRVPSSAPTEDEPTSTPSDAPSTRPTAGPRPTEDGSVTPTVKPTSPKPTEPPDDGDMNGAEEELFTLIDNERQSRGCAPLDRDTSLTHGARDDAESRAASGSVNSTGSSSASTGGDSMSAKSAFSKLKSENSVVLFKCSFDELGVGRGDDERKEGLCPIPLLCTTKTRVAWVVDFS
ncbi:hypothetical protein FB561_3002 [Kribbella amoyensis]|uniref:Uncharacterized protein n=1 Tax=Kribbella amoyensis TaxID=996641 RepID=A0A561BSJ5_9ACTN|nr:hypothetical protein [Kribbella amoyensis]TWD81878.1 hypothetical protein FB561_3002 [Kribbella amoyensis]